MNRRPSFVAAQKLLFLAPVICCVLAAAPNGEPPSGPLLEGQTSLEKQRASVRLQLSRIADASVRQRARQSARASIEKQLAAAAKQRRSAERQMLAARSERAVYTVAAARPVSRAIAPVSPVEAASWRGSSDPGCQRIQPAEIGQYLERVAKRERLDPDLLHVVIAQESSFFPCAVSHKGAMGMMQLMPGTAADLGVSNPFDAEQNIDGGARYLGYLLERFGGDLRLALAAYNAGPSWVDNYQGVPPFPETMNYVRRILGRLPAQKQTPEVRATPGTT